MSRPHLIDADWRIAERDLTLTPAALESVFAVGNGYLGVRGTAEDGTAAHDPGIVLNGFHETWPIVYPEDAYGLARTGQTIVAPPDASMVRLAVEGGARVLRSERTLDMRRGVLLREAELAVPGGRLRLRSRRLASLADRHLVALRLELTMLEGATDLELVSELVLREPDRGGDDDPRRGKGFAERVLEPVSSRAAGTRALLEHETLHSGLRLASGTAHRHGGVPVEISSTAVPDGAETRVRAKLEAGQTLQLEKFAAYHWATGGALAARVAVTLDRAVEAGFDALEDAHAAEVAAFWQRSDVVLEGPGRLQRTVRFNLFQVMQAAARTGGRGIAAKGVTGRGYEGHYFWDTEVYVVPFLAHTNPEWAKRLLTFRCEMLGAARRRAREVGHTGALYPWRTIDGREASAWYAAGTAQYHINADIAYAMHHYNRVTGDLGFMLERGAEVLVETARLWMELGFFSERQDGLFCINSVTGPDEYTTVVDDNAYTNLMAKENLEIATRVVEWLEATDPEAHEALARSTGLREEEVDGWRRAAEAMHVPRHEELGIVLQDARFLERKRWDFAGTPPEKHPLLLHFHPLELYRHQVIKQADVVLATYLVGHHFDSDEKRRTFDYYDPLTTGDSTLSACIQSVMASEVGYPAAALDYFTRAATVDLDDAHGNTGDGIHIASCGGTWLALVAGFGGLRDADGDVRFAPRLPHGWDRLRFRIGVRGQLIEVDMTPEVTAYRLLEGRGLLVEHHGEPLRLAPDATVARPATTALPGTRTAALPRAA